MAGSQASDPAGLACTMRHHNDPRFKLNAGSQSKHQRQSAGAGGVDQQYRGAEGRRPDPRGSSSPLGPPAALPFRLAVTAPPRIVPTCQPTSVPTCRQRSALRWTSGAIWTLSPLLLPPAACRTSSQREVKVCLASASHMSCHGDHEDHSGQEARLPRMTCEEGASDSRPTFESLDVHAEVTSSPRPCRRLVS